MLCLDKLAICCRFGADNFFPVQLIQTVMRDYARNRLASGQEPAGYANTRYPPLRCSVPLTTLPHTSLFIECGAAIDWNGINRPYAKFEFNVDRISRNEEARLRLHRVMRDFLPAGGYAELTEEGYVVYAEFACDIRGIEVATIDAFSPRMATGEWITSNASPGPGTIYVRDGRQDRIEEFCIYDKKKSDFRRHCHLHRHTTLRIEARRRLNRTRTYREMRLTELGTINNPFESFAIYDRARIAQVLAADRHAGFLSSATRNGIQQAFAGTAGQDRARRLRMLDGCRLTWWSPQAAWADIHDAVSTALLL